jgi:hypothetical protein
MSSFTFRAYIPPKEPTSAPPAARSQLNKSSLDGFRSYIPPVVEPLSSNKSPPVFSPGVPPNKLPAFTITPTQYTSSDSSDAKLGSYQRDVDEGQYPLAWMSLRDVQAWIRNKEANNSIELHVKDIIQNKNKREHQWTSRHVYVCSRQGTGGQKKYVPRDTGKEKKERKVPNKRIPCPCRLVVKTYPGTVRVLGRYEGSHSHPTGSDNLKFTRIPLSTREEIGKLLREGVRPEIVVNFLI